MRRWIVLLGTFMWISACSRPQDAAGSRLGNRESRPATEAQDALSSPDPSIAGPAVFAAVRRCAEAKDINAFVDLLCADDKTEMRADLWKEYQALKKNPTRAAKTMGELHLSKNPADMEFEEFSKAFSNASWATRGTDDINLTFGTDYSSVEVATSLIGRGGPFLVVRTMSDGDSGKTRHAVVCVLDEGCWRLSMNLSEEVGMGLTSRYPIRDEPGMLTFDATGAHLITSDAIGLVVLPTSGTAGVPRSHDAEHTVGRLKVSSDHLLWRQTGRWRLSRLSDLQEVHVDQLGNSTDVDLDSGRGWLAMLRGNEIVATDPGPRGDSTRTSLGKGDFADSGVRWASPGQILLFRRELESIECRNIANGGIVWRIPEVPRAASWTVGGSTLAVGFRNTVRSYETAEGTLRARFDLKRGVEGIAVSRDGRWIAVDTAVVAVYDAATGELARELHLRGTVKDPFAWHPTQPLLAATLVKYGSENERSHAIGVFDFGP